MLLLVTALLLSRKITVTEDEPVKAGGLVVSYATGSEALLSKEVSAGIIPTAPSSEETEPVVVLPTLPVEAPADVKEEVAVSVPAFFSPAAYPELSELIGVKYFMEDLLSLEYLKENLYIVNSTTKMTEQDFNVGYFLTKDLSVERKAEPQILIYHTHGSEGFADSRSGVKEDTVIGAGDLLATYLREKYGLNVLHDTTIFDMKDGKDNRNNAYNDALIYMENLLAKYPSVEVIIDLHRDAGEKRVATIQGKKVAKVMLFNGLCRNTKGVLNYLPNEYLKENLAFSFQMKLLGDEMYPGLMNRIFLKDYRYNMHLTERYLLIELGTNKNTVEEAKNAMEPLADVLAHTLGLTENTETLADEFLTE